MSEENKVPQVTNEVQQPVVTPPSAVTEVKEEELVEVLFDYRLFVALIDRAIKSINAVQTVIEGHTIYAKQAADIQTCCVALQTAQSEVEQLRELDQVLRSAQFTNKESVNEKIRKRVVEELTKHFTFSRIDPQVESTDDLVVLDSKPTQPIVEKPQNLPPGRNLSQVTSQERLRREARAEAMKEVGHDPNFYQQIFNEANAPVSTEIPETDTDGLTAEEIATFQQSASVGVDPRAEQLKNKLLPKTLINGSAAVVRGKNRGISRRE